MILRSSRILLEALGFLVAGLAVLLALGVWRLSSGPIEVDFVTPYIEDALSRSDMRVSIRETSVRWQGFDRPIDLVAEGVVLYGDRTLPIARIPALSLSLNVRGLITGRLLPRRIELVRPRVRIERAEDGTFRFGLGDAETPSDTAASDAVGAVLTALRARPGDRTDPLSAIETLSVAGGRITVDDRVLGIRWFAPRADIDLRRADSGVTGEARLDVELGSRVVRLEADLDYRADSGETTAELRVDNFVPADLAAKEPVLAPLSVLASPVRGTMRATFGPTFLPRETTFALEAGAGVLTVEDLYPEPLRVASLGVRGRVDLRGGVMVIEQFMADLGGPRLEGEATVTDRLGTLDLEATVAVTTLPTDLLASYWPAGVGRNAREWITQHLSRGVVRRAEARLHARAPPDDLGAAEILSLDGAIGFDGVTVAYVDGMPPVTDVAGSAAFDLRTFSIDLTAGRLQDLAVTEAKVAITGFEESKEAIDIEVVTAGPVASALAVLDSPPLGYASEMGIDPAEVSGMMSTRLRFAFRLIKDLHFEDVGLAAAANLRDVRLGEVADGISVDGVNGALTLDGRGMEMEGVAELNGVPVDVVWAETFGSGGPQRRLTVSGTLDDQQRAALDLPVYPGLSGAVPVKAVYAVTSAGRATLTADLDLGPARLAIDPIGWVKEPGAPARASATLELVRDKLERVSSFSLEAQDFVARGSASFVPETTELAVLDLAELTSGRNRFGLRASRRDDGGYAVELRGGSLDAASLFDSLVGENGREAAGEDEAGPPLQITLQLDRVYVARNDGSILGANGVMVRGQDSWETIDIAARTDTGAPLRLRYGQGADGGDRLLLTADDAGAALRAFDLVDMIEGGKLTIDGRRVPDSEGADTVFVGDVDMEKFRVVRAPALARILAALSLGGLNDVLNNEGIGFDRLVADYRLDDDILTVSGARTSGGALGLTLDGTVNVATNRLDVEGTIVPLYGVNQVIGAIPLLGDILTGGEGQGVFAFTYRAEGPLGDPSVTVNPLAVLAPGFLRNLFFLEGMGRQPPSGQ